MLVDGSQVTSGTPRSILCSMLGLLTMGMPGAASSASAGDGTLASPDPEKRITQYVHDEWQVEDGLPSNHVQSITQTRDGYLWLATRGGLVRFDGARFRVFNMNNTEVFGTDDFGGLAEDRDGSLWIASRGAGLYRYRQGRFDAYPGSSPAANDLRTLLVDAAGRLWIGTLGGLFQFREDRLVPADAPPELAVAHVSALHETADGTIWIGTRGHGVFRYLEGAYERFSSAERLSGDLVSGVLEDRKGAVWIGTDGDGLYRRERLEGGEEVTVYRQAQGLADDRIRSLHEDPAGSLWIATQRGLNRFRDGSFESFVFRPELTADAVQSLFVDREGNLWAGTFGSGLHRFKDGRITSYTTREGLSHNRVWSVYEDRLERLWIGFDEGGLDRFEDGRMAPFVAARDFPARDAYSILRDSAGKVWIGTSNGLARYADGDLRLFTTADGLSNDRVRIVYQSPNETGVLWLGTFGGGVNRFRDGVFTVYDTTAGLSHENVRALHMDRTGALWIGTEVGLNRLRDGEIEVFTTADGLSGNSIRSFHEDAEGVLWIGTKGGGLMRYRDGMFASYTTRDGLPQNDMWAILEDDRQRLWWSSDQGITRVRKSDIEAYDRGLLATVPARTYGLADGMKAVECNSVGYPAGWKSADGRFWFASMAGVVRVDPHPQPAGEPPPVHVESVTVDQKLVEPRGLVELPPGQSDLELQYTALRFCDPERVRFRYQLVGYDADWIDAGNRRTAYYTNIPPGTYTFRVVATHDEAGWQRESEAIRIELAPPWWRTRWSSGLYGVVLFAGVVLVHRIQRFRLIRRERQRAKVLEAGLRAEAAELEARALQAENERRKEELARAGELELAYHALEQKNKELETLDRIVHAINRELNLEDVTKSLMEQGLKLLPRAERAVFSILDHESDHFEFVATYGWDEEFLKDLTWTAEEAVERYLEGAEEIGEGVFLARDPGKRSGAEKLRHLPYPPSTALLSIAVAMEEKVLGLLIFTLYASDDELERLDVRRVERYRQHAISALDKARAYSALKDKNRQVEEKNEEILEAQARMLEQTSFLNSLIESSPLAIVVLDSRRRVRMCNPAFESLFLYTRSEIVGRPLREVISSEETAAEVASAIDDTLQGKSVHLPATHRRRKDGSRVEVEVHAVPLITEGRYAGSIGLYLDISERKRAERALFEEKERAQVTLDSIGDAVIRTDAAGIVEYLNPVAEALTGWTMDEAQGRALNVVFRAVDEKSRGAADPVARCLSQAGAVPAWERDVLLSRSGEEYPIRASAAPIRGREEEVLGVVLVFRDVTSERRMAQQVIQSEKMASLGQLVAGVAHEINNPVNFISSGLPSLRRDIGKLAARVAADEGDGGHEALRRRIARLLAAIEDGAHRTAEIVRNLRSFSRLEAAEITTVDLHQALDTTLSLLHNQTKGRIRVVKRYGDIPAVECYPGQLNQVFMNLLVNAIQAIDGQGTITLTTGRDGDEDVRISIRDTGRGMSDDVRRKIFDPFFTTKPVGQGTGLGLSISHGIIEEHAGTIEVASQPGGGTECTIILPVRVVTRDPA